MPLHCEWCRISRPSTTDTHRTPKKYPYIVDSWVNKSEKPMIFVKTVNAAARLCIHTQAGPALREMQSAIWTKMGRSSAENHQLQTSWATSRVWLLWTSSLDIEGWRYIFGPSSSGTCSENGSKGCSKSASCAACLPRFNVD
eukprot:2031468-Amphidinium_carterae.2